MQRSTKTNPNRARLQTYEKVCIHKDAEDIICPRPIHRSADAREPPIINVLRSESSLARNATIRCSAFGTQEYRICTSSVVNSEWCENMVKEQQLSSISLSGMVNSQFGCFQFSAAQTSGLKDPNTIRLRGLLELSVYTVLSTASTKLFTSPSRLCSSEYCFLEAGVGKARSKKRPRFGGRVCKTKL